MGKRQSVVVDGGGYVYVDGVKIGKKIVRDGGEIYIQSQDKDRRRSAKRGTDKVECHLTDLIKAVQNGDGSVSNLSTLDTKD